MDAIAATPVGAGGESGVRAIALVLALQIRVWFAHELVQMMQCAHPPTLYRTLPGLASRFRDFGLSF